MKGKIWILNVVVFLLMVLFRDELLSTICISFYVVEFIVWFFKNSPKDFFK